MVFVATKFAVGIETKYAVFRYKTSNFRTTKIVVEIWKFWNLISEEAGPTFSASVCPSPHRHRDGDYGNGALVLRISKQVPVE